MGRVQVGRSGPYSHAPVAVYWSRAQRHITTVWSLLLSTQLSLICFSASEPYSLGSHNSLETLARRLNGLLCEGILISRVCTWVCIYIFFQVSYPRGTTVCMDLRPQSEGGPIRTLQWNGQRGNHRVGPAPYCLSLQVAPRLDVLGGPCLSTLAGSG
jgi:hypothetical protein